MRNLRHEFTYQLCSSTSLTTSHWVAANSKMCRFTQYCVMQQCSLLLELEPRQLVAHLELVLLLVGLPALVLNPLQGGARCHVAEWSSFVVLSSRNQTEHLDEEQQPLPLAVA